MRSVSLSEAQTFEADLIPVDKLCRDKLGPVDKAFEGSRDDPARGQYQSPLSKLHCHSSMRASLQVVSTLLIILSALLSEGSAKLESKRVLPGTLVRHFDKVNTARLWRVVLTSMRTTPEDMERTEEQLDKLVRELTKEQVAAPNKASEMAEELMR